jgi:hypothetical protein
MANCSEDLPFVGRVSRPDPFIPSSFPGAPSRHGRLLRRFAIPTCRRVSRPAPFPPFVGRVSRPDPFIPSSFPGAPARHGRLPRRLGNHGIHGTHGRGLAGRHAVGARTPSSARWLAVMPLTFAGTAGGCRRHADWPQPGQGLAGCAGRRYPPRLRVSQPGHGHPQRKHRRLYLGSGVGCRSTNLPVNGSYSIRSWIEGAAAAWPAMSMAMTPRSASSVTEAVKSSSSPR